MVVALLGLAAVLTGAPAIAGVGGQGQPAKQVVVKATGSLQLLEGVGGAIDLAWKALAEFLAKPAGKETRDALGDRVIEPSRGKGVGGQGVKGVGGQG